MDFKKLKKSLAYGITLNVILLGLTSFFTDLSSELIVPLIPIFMASLGASVVVIGILSGLSDSAISLFQFFSGYWVDRTGKRKKFVIIGYSASAIAKFIMSFATSWMHILILRPVERIGKGMREPPRDVILAETTPKKAHGKIFGIHKAFDTAGAIWGSSIAAIFLALGLTINKIFLIASAVAILSIIPLFFVKDKKARPKKISLRVSFKKLPKNLRIFIVISAIFALADFGYMFLILRAQQLFHATTALFLYISYNIAFEIFTIPSGIIADKFGKKRMIFYGYLLFSLVCLGFAFFNSVPLILLGFILYGISYSFIIGNQRALVADLADDEKGVCFGTFHMAVSIASLPAGIIAGVLWQYISPVATFFFGAFVSLFAGTILALSTFDDARNENKILNAEKDMQ